MTKHLPLLLCAAALAAGQTRALHPAITSALAAVSEDRIAATMKKLESFGTRDIHSVTNAAAQQWLAAEFKAAHPRLEVSLDPHQILKKGRVQRDLTVTNVVAKLPGKVHPDVHLLLIAHYDSREFSIGDVNEYTLKNVSIDDIVIGIKAVNPAGIESLVAPYAQPPRPLAATN